MRPNPQEAPGARTSLDRKIAGIYQDLLTIADDDEEAFFIAGEVVRMLRNPSKPRARGSLPEAPLPPGALRSLLSRLPVLGRGAATARRK